MNRVLITDDRLCRIAALVALLLGPLGMVTSMLYLDSTSAGHVVAGAVGFLAGALVGAGGLVSLAVMERRVPGT